MTAALLLGLVAFHLATAVLAVARAGKPDATGLVYGACAVTSALALLLSAAWLLGAPLGAASTAALPLGLPWLGASFRIDALAAFFLVLVNLGGGAASLYGLGYGRHEAAPHRVLPFFPTFLGAMNLVVLADDAFAFLWCWEIMSLASWALVMAHHRAEENRRAAYIYLVMASFGTLSLLLAFGLLAGATGAYDFATIRASTPTPEVAALVLCLLLVGAGSKAGLVPLHVWLPLAHPAAPSHVSALMSGVMTKVAVYGFLRIVLDLAGEPAWWAGLVVLFLGGVTAALGILHALMETDLKRLLAYSTIENIGVVFAGIGLALAFRANAMGSAAALALTAALFHMLNHTLFKSLLFFGAGAVLTATGSRDMERLGGLIHRMPVTSVVFLLGCVAISALPPLNGFASEWLLFQAVLQSPSLPQWGLKIMVPAMGGLLALAAALAAVCFVKAYGITFLGRPRGPEAAAAVEVDPWSTGTMIGLAILCLATGTLPGLVIDALAPVATLMVGQRLPLQIANDWLSIQPLANGHGSYNGLLVFLFIASTASLAAFLIHRLGTAALRRGPAWGCGFLEPSPATQYTGSSFAQPIRRVYGTLAFRAKERVDMPPPGDGRPAVHAVVIRDLVWEGIFAPVAGVVDRVAGELNRLQFLTIRKYLSLVFASLVTLLLVIAIWG